MEYGGAKTAVLAFLVSKEDIRDACRLHTRDLMTWELKCRELMAKNAPQRRGVRV